MLRVREASSPRNENHVAIAEGNVEVEDFEGDVDQPSATAAAVNRTDQQPGVSVRLRAEDGTFGDRGILEIKSPGLMIGYWHRPDKQPFTPDGWYSTGDVFRRDAKGCYFFVSRKDDMFVCGGENLYPAPIERVLEAHPAVA